MICVGMWNVGAERDTDEQIVKIFNQQAGIRSPLLPCNFWVLAVRVICKKLCGQTVNITCIFHRFTLQTEKKSGKGCSPSPLGGFVRSVFILPLSQNRHSTSSLGQFLFYRRVRTVTRLMGNHPTTIIISPAGKYVNSILGSGGLYSILYENTSLKLNALPVIIEAQGGTFRIFLRLYR